VISTGQAAGQGRLDLALVLAQLGLDERQVEEGVASASSRTSAARASAPVSGSPSSPIRWKPYSDRLQPRSRARAGA
jgi:hypothetical protein